MIDHLSTPLHLGTTTLFGLILLLGLFGGELVKKIRFLPRIFGYIAVGFLIGPAGFNLVEISTLEQNSIFIDISLGLILFEIGRNLDFSWLKHDYNLLWMSLAESGITFVLLFGALYLLGLPCLPAALVATIGIATAPAVLIRVTQDLNSHGPITRRSLILTSLNNLFALVIFTILFPLAHLDSAPFSQVLSHIGYHLLGAFILAFIMFILTQLLARLVGKISELQFILLAGVVVLAIGLARMFHLSTMLTLFILGVAARNFDRKHRLTPVNFDVLARFFLIILFVLIGIYMQPHAIWQETLAVLAFVVCRFIGKFSGVFLYAKSSRLTQRQASATALALMPMAGVALGMSFTLINLNPGLGNLLVAIVSGALAIMNIIGPVITQWAFLIVGESADTRSHYRTVI